MDPNCKLLGNSTVEMFGIQFKIVEGSSEGYYPIKKVAERSHISVDFIEKCLKKYGLMTKEGDWSDSEYPMIDKFNDISDGSLSNTAPVAGLVMQKLYAVPKGKYATDCEPDELIYLGIHVHEQFILQLMKKD